MRERDSGFPRRKGEYDSLDFEAILLWDEAVASYERARHAREAQMFELLVAMAAR